LDVVDDAALRILRQQVRFAQGRDPDDYTPEVIGCEAHRHLAREAAQKSIVLLKNDGELLPLADVRYVGGLRPARRRAQHRRPRLELDAAPPRHNPLQGVLAAGGAAFKARPPRRRILRRPEHRFLRR
jgi:beta-glucosidase-like glycosyl hydrolase